MLQIENMKYITLLLTKFKTFGPKVKSLSVVEKRGPNNQDQQDQPEPSKTNKTSKTNKSTEVRIKPDWEAGKNSS